MRVLFSMRHVGSVRMYESVLRRLAGAGHEIHILANRRESVGSDTPPETLLDDCPQVTWSWEEIRPNAWIELATAVRIWLDYLRYFEPRYSTAPRLRIRAADRVPPLLRRVTEWPGVRTRPGRHLLARALRAIERALPRQADCDDVIRHHRPDVVLLTPLLHLGSPQIELLRSARALGARTALCVGSWDHLSSKSLIREVPDRVFVWNETQKREAVDLHGVPPARVAVTGAQCYDQWFDRVPVRTRAEFCAQLALPPERPFLMWVCSALFPGSPIEAQFVRRWIAEMRASSDPVLASAGILVRPHPARLEEWRAVDLSDIPNVTVHGSLPLDEPSKRDYFESLYLSAAVVGLNTSAFLEAGIVGRPVHTIVLPEFSDNQEGTLHFDYLLRVGGGLLRVARTFDEHRVQLAASLREAERPDRNAAFVEAFVRPHGLRRAATETFAAAIETFGQAPAPAPARTPAWAAALRLAVFPLALLTHVAVGRAAHPSDRTFFELRRARAKDVHRREREAQEQRRQAEREAQRDEKVRRSEAARLEAVRAREERIAASEREKSDRRHLKERDKRHRQRAKRRAAFVSTLKRHIGLGEKQTR